MKKALSLVLLFAASIVRATPMPIPTTLSPLIIVSSASASAGGTVTATVPATASAGAYSTGYSNYIANISIGVYSNGGAAGATKFTCTTTNMSGLAFDFVPAVSTGSISYRDLQFSNPVQSTSTVAMSITCPSNSALMWNVIIGYFTGQ